MNAVIMSFDPQGKQCNLQEKAIKRVRAVESDSVKSARKAKDKLHKACERASEIRERTLHKAGTKRNAHGKHESRDSLTGTITCPDALRVWHFSAFHL